MDNLVFIEMWVYGLIVTASVSYLSFQVMESWLLRHIKFHIMFGLVALVLQLAGLTLFSYWAIVLTSVTDTMLYTALFHLVTGGAAWTLRRYLKRHGFVDTLDDLK